MFDTQKDKRAVKLYHNIVGTVHDWHGILTISFLNKLIFAPYFILNASLIEAKFRMKLSGASENHKIHSSGQISETQRQA